MKREQIGTALRRSLRSIEDWKKTEAWAEIVEEIMREKRMMHMLDIAMTGQAMMRKIMASQWNL